jgi:hypothetical protein
LGKGARLDDRRRALRPHAAGLRLLRLGAGSGLGRGMLLCLLPGSGFGSGPLLGLPTKNFLLLSPLLH